MSRTISFGGVTQTRPGALTRINTNALTGVPTTATGIVALLGEADKGPPGEIVEITDPVVGLETFGTGPLADAVKLAFDPSGDTRIPGGAFKVLAYKTNNSTKSALSFYGSTGLATSTIKTGSSVTAVKFTAGGLPNGTVLKDFWVRVSLTGGGYDYRRIASVEGGETINLVSALTSVTTGNAITIFHNEIDIQSLNYGTDANNIHASITEEQITVADGTSTESFTITELLDKYKNTFRMMYTGGAIAKSGKAYGNVSAASSTVVRFTAQSGAGSGAVDGDLNNKILEIPSLGLRRKIGASDWDPGSAGADVVDITFASGHELTSAQAAALGTSTVRVLDVTSATALVFGKAGQAQGIVTYINGVESFKYKFPTSPTPQTLSSFESVVEAGNPYIITVEDGVNASLLQMKDLSFATNDSKTNSIGGVNCAVDIRFDTGVVTNSTNFERGAYGLVELFGEKITLVNASRETTEVAIQDSTGVTDTGCTTSSLIVTPSPSWTTDQHKGKWVTISSQTVFITSNTSDTLKVFPELSSAPSSGVSLVIYNYGNGSGALDLVDDTYLTGGTRGISTNASFSSGFDALLLERHNHIVPLIDQDLINEGNGSTATWSSVSGQLLEHVSAARLNAKNECGGYIGLKGTKSQIKSALLSLNDADVQLTSQRLERLNASSEMTILPYWSSAVSAAGMRAGAESVGEPLTYKFVKTSSISQDSSWSPSRASDVNELVGAGLLFIEKADQGFRWVRDMTTWVKNDNIAFMEGSTRDVVRYIAYDFRKTLEDQFTGLRGTPTTLSDIRNFCSTKLNLYRDSSIITPSYDTEGIYVPNGWRKLRVFANGNTVTVRVEIYPVIGISFELLDITLQQVSLSA